jgi:hypothetical protein
MSATCDGSSQKTPTVAEQKAKQAIGYTLRRISEDPELAWRFIATQSHALLIEACSELSGVDRERLKDNLVPKESYPCRRCKEEGRVA